MSARAQSLLWLGLVPAIFAADWVSKAFARRLLPEVEVQLIPYLLDLRLIFNRGIAFGLFADSARWWHYLIALLSMLLTGFALYQVARPSARSFARLGWALFAGGALGNLWERLASGQVTDFLALRLHTLPLFIFNLADAALSCAVVLLVLDEVLRSRTASTAPD